MGNSAEAAQPATPQPSTESPTSGQSNPSETTAGFTAEDFAHPVYGPKAKNLQRLHEKGVEELKRIREEQAEARAQVEKWNAFLAQHTDIQEAVKERIYGKQSSEEPVPPADEGTNEESELAKIRQELREMRGLLSADKAMLPIYSELGNGNIAAGQERYKQEYATEMANLSRAWTQGSPEDVAKLSFEHLKLKRQASQPKPPPEPPGSINADADGGTVAMPQARPSNRAEAEKATMAALGATSDQAFETIMRRLDD